MFQTMGHAIPRVGFYCLEFEEEDEEVEAVASNVAVISCKLGVLSVRILEDKLKHLVSEEWDWQVRQFTDAEFEVVFTS